MFKVSYKKEIKNIKNEYNRAKHVQSRIKHEINSFINLARASPTDKIVWFYFGEYTFLAFSLYECRFCQKKSYGKYKYRRCSGCHRIYYCSAGCQAKDWDAHKLFCSEDLQHLSYPLHQWINNVTTYHKKEERDQFHSIICQLLDKFSLATLNYSVNVQAKNDGSLNILKMEAMDKQLNIEWKKFLVKGESPPFSLEIWFTIMDNEIPIASRGVLLCSYDITANDTTNDTAMIIEKMKRKNNLRPNIFEGANILCMSLNILMLYIIIQLLLYIFPYFVAFLPYFFFFMLFCFFYSLLSWFLV